LIVLGTGLGFGAGAGFEGLIIFDSFAFSGFALRVLDILGFITAILFISF
jgi:hypothetical protein